MDILVSARRSFRNKYIERRCQSLITKHAHGDQTIRAFDLVLPWRNTKAVDQDPAQRSFSIAIIGRGRMGRALDACLVESGLTVHGPYGREDIQSGTVSDAGADIVVLAVPDSAIMSVAQQIEPGPVVGHLSGATPLAVLAPHESFVLHPLLTVTGVTSRFTDAFATVSGSTERARKTAEWLAVALGMRHMPLKESDRAAYHASASIASNFVMTVLGFAEDLASRSGLDREALAPLVRASVNNWVELGAREALTGPIVRGDHATVSRQRAAVGALLPRHLPLFDALVSATKDLAESP